MNFLDKLVIPLSPEHIALLHYIAMLVFFLFVPYISMVFGGTILSLFYKRKGLKESNHIYLRFARDVIETVTINTSMGIVLGIMALVTAILLYIQMFHMSNLVTVNFLTGSLFLVTFGLILIFTYRYSFSFNEFFKTIKEFHTQDESFKELLSKYREKSRRLSKTPGRFGLLFLFLGIWVFTAAIVIAAFPAEWGVKGFIALMFSWDVIFKLITFIFGAFAFTGSVILFSFFYLGGGKSDMDESYKEFASKTAISAAGIGMAALPVMIWINISFLPNDSFSNSVFVYVTAAILLLLLGYHYLYVMYKNSDVRYSVHIFYVALFILMALVVKDQLTIGNATKKQSEKLAANFEQVMQKLTAPTKKVKISGKEIYTNICSACHAFDHKVVGPPYEQTLPTFKGNVDELVKFILHPTHKVPGYPDMPNPGLNPAQARAVATYILKEVKKYE